MSAVAATLGGLRVVELGPGIAGAYCTKVLAGFGAGVLSTTVGVASLLSFPVLLAVGLPPVVANVSNTIGLVPSGVGGGVGYRDELRVHPHLTRVVAILTGVAGAAGAVLLLALPPGVFEAIVPWLILFTCLLVGVLTGGRHHSLFDNQKTSRQLLAFSF